MFLFENLEVYKKAKNLVNEIYKIITDHKKSELYFQLERSTISICLNIAEGSGRNTSKDKNISTILRAVLF